MERRSALTVTLSRPPCLARYRESDDSDDCAAHTGRGTPANQVLERVWNHRCRYRCSAYRAFVKGRTNHSGIRPCFDVQRQGLSEYSAGGADAERSSRLEGAGIR